MVEMEDGMDGIWTLDVSTNNNSYLWASQSAVRSSKQGPWRYATAGCVNRA